MVQMTAKTDDTSRDSFFSLGALGILRGL